MGGLVAHVILVSIGLLVLGLGLRLGLRGLDLGLELDNFQIFNDDVSCEKRQSYAPYLE